MTLMAFRNAWVDAVRPVKATIRNAFRDQVGAYLTLTELRGTDTGGTRLIHVDGAPFLLDAADTTSTDNGLTIVVSADNYRYKLIGAIRQKLTAAINVYVRTDGDDNNDGLANSSGRAFRTIQKAVNFVASLDLGIYGVTINVTSGTFAENVSVAAPWSGSGSVVILGNTGTPANCKIAPTTGIAVSVTNGARLQLSGLDLSSGNNALIYAAQGGDVTVTGAMRFGGAGNAQLYTQLGGRINVTVSYTIYGSAPRHILATNQSTVLAAGVTVTLSGTPAFSTAFAQALNVSLAGVYSNTYSGAATGARYSVSTNGVISTFGAGATYLPGDVAGSSGTGGQYV